MNCVSESERKWCLKCISSFTDYQYLSLSRLKVAMSKGEKYVFCINLIFTPLNQHTNFFIDSICRKLCVRFVNWYPFKSSQCVRFVCHSIHTYRSSFEFDLMTLFDCLLFLNINNILMWKVLMRRELNEVFKVHRGVSPYGGFGHDQFLMCSYAFTSTEWERERGRGKNWSSSFKCIIYRLQNYFGHELAVYSIN